MISKESNSVKKISVKITEVGPRDGLQNEKKIVSLSDKLKYIKLLSESGLKFIEATSFVKPEAIPQLADSIALAEALKTIPTKTEFCALTPNKKGYDQALQAGIKEVAVFTAASETFTKKNINCSIRESIQRFEEIFRMAKNDGIKVRGYISCILVCPYEGIIIPEKVSECAKMLLDSGAYEVSLGDTIGAGVPVQLERLLHELFRFAKPDFFAGHYHDTYGMAIANVNKSLEMGIRSFDSSSGGLGGCPYARGASGNLATEDLIYFLENSGYSTGIQMEKILQATQFISDILQKEPVSRVYKVMQSKN